MCAVCHQAANTSQVETKLRAGREVKGPCSGRALPLCAWCLSVAWGWIPVLHKQGQREGGWGPAGRRPHCLAWLCCRRGGRKRRANGRLQQGNGACRSISLSWRVRRLPAPLPQPSPADAGGLWFVSRGPGGGAGGRRPCHGGGQGRDGVLSAPTLRCWELRSCGAGGDRALPEAGEGGAEGIGRCRRPGGVVGRGDRVQP